MLRRAITFHASHTHISSKGPLLISLKMILILTVGGWFLDEAPPLSAEVIVVAERLASTGKRGKFIEVFGRLPQKPLPQKKKGNWK